MRVPDVIQEDLDVLFVGVNPGIRSGQTRHHYAHPSGRFWKALYDSGFTSRLLAPEEELLLLDYGIGVTNLVHRPTASASDLSAAELRRGATALRRKACRFRPAWAAILGIGAYRIGFQRPDAWVGSQEQTLCATRLWVLPGPTGRNAHFTQPRLVEEFVRLRQAIRR